MNRQIHRRSVSSSVIGLVFITSITATAREPASAPPVFADPSPPIVQKKKGLFDGWFGRKPERVAKSADEDDDDDDDGGKRRAASNRMETLSPGRSSGSTSVVAATASRVGTSDHALPPVVVRAPTVRRSQSAGRGRVERVTVQTSQNPASKSAGSSTSKAATDEFHATAMPVPAPVMLSDRQEIPDLLRSAVDSALAEVSAESPDSSTAQSPTTVVYSPEKAAETTQALHPKPKPEPKTRYAKPVPGRKGLVYPPGVPEKMENMIDVRDIPPGTKVRDPITNTVFFVP